MGWKFGVLWGCEAPPLAPFWDSVKAMLLSTPNICLVRSRRMMLFFVPDQPCLLSPLDSEQWQSPCFFLHQGC